MVKRVWSVLVPGAVGFLCLWHLKSVALAPYDLITRMPSKVAMLAVQHDVCRALPGCWKVDFSTVFVGRGETRRNEAPGWYGQVSVVTRETRKQAPGSNMGTDERIQPPSRARMLEVAAAALARSRFAALREMAGRLRLSATQRDPYIWEHDDAE